MKIDAVLGLVTFPEITIGPHITRPEFLQTSVGKSAEEGVVNKGWVTLHVIPEAGWPSSLIFKDDKLIQLFTAMDLHSTKADEWSPKFEMHRKAKHDAWLRSELGGPPYDYLWGTVGSEFDPRSCSSNIIITFGTFPLEPNWRDKKQRPT